VTRKHAKEQGLAALQDALSKLLVDRRWDRQKRQLVATVDEGRERRTVRLDPMSPMQVQRELLRVVGSLEVFVRTFHPDLLRVDFMRALHELCVGLPDADEDGR
jgi:hypothetical protein